MKDKIQQIFLALLRMGLWGKGKFPDTEPLSAEEWTVLYQYALNHTVEGILFDSFSLLPEEQLPPRPLRIKWAVRVDQIERHNEWMRRITVEQFAYFTQADTKPILLKGQGVGSCYRWPLHRISGDIDWYFDNDGYERVLKRLQEKKIAVDAALDYSLSYDWQGIAVEHHRRLFDIYSPFKTAYLRTLEETYRSEQQTVLIAGKPITLLAPELQILQVNIHILKHLLAFGIGLRQICDAAMLYHAYRDQIDAEQLCGMYKKLGILKWIQVLHGLLVKHLGLPKADLPFPYPGNLKVDWMLDEIWHAGNFGFHDERFTNGEASFVTTRADGTRRLWRGVRRYFKYAPQEAFFFPIRHAVARITAMFSKKS